MNRCRGRAQRTLELEVSRELTHILGVRIDHARHLVVRVSAALARDLGLGFAVPAHEELLSKDIGAKVLQQMRNVDGQQASQKSAQTRRAE